MVTLALTALERLSEATPGGVRLGTHVEGEGFVGATDAAWVEAATYTRFMDAADTRARTSRGGALARSIRTDSEP